MLWRYSCLTRSFLFLCLSSSCLILPCLAKADYFESNRWTHWRDESGLKFMPDVWDRNCTPSPFAGDNIVNMCEYNYPFVKGKRMWFVVFHTPWCGMCKRKEPEYKALADHFKDDPKWGIAHVDCEVERGTKAWCEQDTGVRGFPTNMIVTRGKNKTYNGDIDIPTMTRYLGTVANMNYGGFKACSPGIFKKNPHVQPLCEVNYPDARERAQWIVFFYDHSATEEMKDSMTTLATDLGNVAKKQKGKASKGDIVKKIAKKYELADTLPGVVDLSAQVPLVRVGAVCCDCDKDVPKFCTSLQFSGRREGNQVFWVTDGISKAWDPTPELTPKAMMTLVWEQLSKQPAAREEL